MPTRDYEPRSYREPEDEFWRFIKIGAAVTIGVVSVLSIAWLAQLAWVNYQLKRAATQLSTSLQQLGNDGGHTVSASYRTSAPNYGAPFFAHSEAVHIRPKDRAVCMQEHAGKFDESYLRCVNGWSYTVWVTSPEQLASVRQTQASSR